MLALLFLGAAISLYGSLPKFEPVRAKDCVRPMWGTLASRENFVPLKTRAGVLSQCLTLPPPPDNYVEAENSESDGGLEEPVEEVEKKQQ